MASIASAAEWKKVLKDHPDAVDHAPLTKALEDYGRVSGKDDVAQVADALGNVIDRARAVKKKNAKAKELVKFADEVIGDAEKALAEATKRLDEADEEKELGARLRAGLILARKVDADAAKGFALALGQVPGLVVAKRPAITRAHLKAAREMRTGKGKLFTGVCFGESGKYIFLLEDKPPGGLTRLIKKAAKVHADLEIRLKVRGGGVELDDETDLDELTDFGEDTEDGAEGTTPEDGGGPQGTDQETEGGPQTVDGGDQIVEALRLKLPPIVQKWEQARALAAQGVETMGASLRGLGYPEALEAADVVDDLTENFPDDLDTSFDGLGDAITVGDAELALQMKDRARADVKTCLEYLSANKSLIEVLEGNDFGLNVQVRAPLVDALKAILADLK